MRESPHQANRSLSVLSKMSNLAETWGLRKDGGNPRRFAQEYKGKKRECFLTDQKFHRLGQMPNEIEAECSETLSAETAEVMFHAAWTRQQPADYCRSRSGC